MGFPGDEELDALRRRVGELERLSGASADPKLKAAPLELGVALGNRGEVDEALEVFARSVELYGDAEDPVLRQVVAWSLYLRSGLFFGRDDVSSALHALEEIRKRFTGASDDVVRGVVLMARLGEARTLVDEEQLVEALSVYDEILSGAPEIDERYAEVQAQIAVATALLRRSEVLRKLGHSGDALATYADFSRRFSHSRDEEIRRWRAHVLEGKAFVLFQSDLYESALETLARLFDELAADPLPDLGECVAGAVTTRTLCLMSLGRMEEALASTNEFFDRYWDGARPNQRMRALGVAALIHLALGHGDEALRLYDRALEMSGDADRTHTVALTASQRARALLRLGRRDEASAALEGVIARYHDDPDEDVQEIVAKARESLSKLGS